MDNNFILLIIFAGEVFEHYFLSYKCFVPRNLTRKIEQMKKSMLENGLDQFYRTFAMFRGRINYNNIDKGTVGTDMLIGTIRLEQLYFFFMIYFIQIAFAIIVFIIEVNIHRWN